MVNACVPKKSPDICFGEIQFGITLALAFYKTKNKQNMFNNDT